MRKVTAELQRIPEALKIFFIQWRNQCDKCGNLEAEYFEDDMIKFVKITKYLVLCPKLGYLYATRIYNPTTCTSSNIQDGILKLFGIMFTAEPFQSVYNVGENE